MIVITGSESFIGRSLTAQLDKHGQPWRGIDTCAKDPRCTSGDIRDEGIEKLIPEGTSALIHLAAISRDADCRADARTAFDVNVGGTINLINAAKARRIRQFVFASSEWVYGEVENDGIQYESSPIDANRVISEYALTKICGERLLAAAVDRGEIAAATVLRFGIVYGPRASNWSAVEALYHAVESKEVIEVRGCVRSSRRFIHVGDVASGILSALNRDGFEIFNLSGDRLISLREIIEQSSKIADRHPAVVEGNPAALSIRNPDNRLAREVLNWIPQYTLDEGLAGLASSHE